jgi:hypothetical protein
LPSPALHRPLGVTTTEKRSVERVSDHRVNSWKFNGFISQAVPIDGAQRLIFLDI